MTRSEIDAIIVAYLNKDIGEALRLVGEATERDRAELQWPGILMRSGGRSLSATSASSRGRERGC